MRELSHPRKRYPLLSHIITRTPTITLTTLITIPIHTHISTIITFLFTIVGGKDENEQVRKET